MVTLTVPVNHASWVVWFKIHFGLLCLTFALSEYDIVVRAGGHLGVFGWPVGDPGASGPVCRRRETREHGEAGRVWGVRVLSRERQHNLKSAVEKENEIVFNSKWDQLNDVWRELVYVEVVQYFYLCQNKELFSWRNCDYLFVWDSMCFHGAIATVALNPIQPINRSRKRTLWTALKSFYGHANPFLVMFILKFYQSFPCIPAVTFASRHPKWLTVIYDLFLKQ